jgi:hypothetical protein
LSLGHRNANPNSNPSLHHPKIVEVLQNSDAYRQTGDLLAQMSGERILAPNSELEEDDCLYSYRITPSIHLYLYFYDGKGSMFIDIFSSFCFPVQRGGAPSVDEKG